MMKLLLYYSSQLTNTQLILFQLNFVPSIQDIWSIELKMRENTAVWRQARDADRLTDASKELSNRSRTSLVAVPYYAMSLLFVSQCLVFWPRNLTFQKRSRNYFG